MTNEPLERDSHARRLKKELKNRLRVPVEEPIFAQLEESGAFKDALSELSKQRDRGAVLNRLRANYWKRRAARALSSGAVANPEKRTGLHLEAISWRAAALADQRQDVQKFRDEFLSGGVLEPEEIARFHATKSDSAIRTRLRNIACSLSRAFRWSEADGELFVLTANAPGPPRPTFGVERAKLGQPDWITLSYDAHATEKDVLKIHRAARSQLADGFLGLGADMKKRKASLTTAELAAFIDETNDGRSWEAALSAFNERYPERQHDDVGNFATAAKAAFLAMFQDDIDWKASEKTTARRLAQVVEDAKRRARSTWTR